MDEGQSSTR